MSRRFSIGTLFIIMIFVGGIMTGDQEPVTFLEGLLMIGGFIGAITSLLLLNNKWGNKKLF